MITVVSAILMKHGRILLQQRPPLKDFAFCWESPGGKVENENHLQALRREVLEELDVDIGELPRSQQPIWSGRFDNVVTRPDRASVELFFYMIGDRFNGAPIPREGQPGVGLFSIDEMLCIDLAPANSRAKFEIAQEMRRAGAR